MFLKWSFLKCFSFLFCAVVSVIFICGCSDDSVVVAPEPEIVEPKPELKSPHADYSIIPVEIGGRFQTGGHLIERLIELDLVVHQNSALWSLKRQFYHP